MNQKVQSSLVIVTVTVMGLVNCHIVNCSTRHDTTDTTVEADSTEQCDNILAQQTFKLWPWSWNVVLVSSSLVSNSNYPSLSPELLCKIQIQGLSGCVETAQVLHAVVNKTQE